MLFVDSALLLLFSIIIKHNIIQYNNTEYYQFQTNRRGHPAQDVHCLPECVASHCSVWHAVCTLQSPSRPAYFINVDKYALRLLTLSYTTYRTLRSLMNTETHRPFISRLGDFTLVRFNWILYYWAYRLKRTHFRKEYIEIVVETSFPTDGVHCFSKYL